MFLAQQIHDESSLFSMFLSCFSFCDLSALMKKGREKANISIPRFTVGPIGPKPHHDIHLNEGRPRESVSFSCAFQREYHC
jgi:hypothetical protein